MFRQQGDSLSDRTIPISIMTGIIDVGGIGDTWDDFDYWTTSLIALAGGLLGVLLMIPMRRVFVLGSPDLKYPEAVACAAVLRAGSEAEAVELANRTEYGLGASVWSSDAARAEALVPRIEAGAVFVNGVVEAERCRRIFGEVDASLY